MFSILLFGSHVKKSEHNSANNIENAFKTGIFKISRTIENLPEVESVYSSKAEKNGNTYRTAVITCTNGEGYEFSLDMINK